MSRSKIHDALALFASCIKSGERWTPECQAALDAAKTELEGVERLVGLVSNSGLPDVPPRDSVDQYPHKRWVQRRFGLPVLTAEQAYSWVPTAIVLEGRKVVAVVPTDKLLEKYPLMAAEK